LQCREALWPRLPRGMKVLAAPFARAAGVDAGIFRHVAKDGTDRAILSGYGRKKPSCGVSRGKCRRSCPLRRSWQQRRSGMQEV
jgi:hypothetical protein